MRTAFLLALIAAAAPAPAADNPAATAADADLLAQYQELRKLTLDPERTAVTEEFVLKKDAAAFQFKTGRMYFLKPIFGRVTAAVFVGQGVFTLKPPNPIEAGSLARFLDGKTELAEPFDELLMIFTDGTFDELSAGLKMQPAPASSKAAGLLEDLRNTFRDRIRTNLEARVLADLCRPAQGQFLADIRGPRKGKLLFNIDPLTQEEIQLVHYNNALEYFDLWNSFRAANAIKDEEKPIADTLETVIDAAIDKGEKLAATATIEFTALQDGPRMVEISLASPLRVTKATFGEAELKFVQEDKKKDAGLWLILPKPLAKGERYKLTIAYAGEDVIQSAGSGNFYVGARTRWFPRIHIPSEEFGDRGKFRMKFSVPKEYTMVATGKQISKKTEGKVTVTEWETDPNYQVVGFNYGAFKSKSAPADNVEVTVFANTGLGDELNGLRQVLDASPDLATQLGITTGGFNTTRMIDMALAEAAGSVKLFSHYFGPAPFPTLAVSQQPSKNYGQSWPTLVFMPYSAFLDSTTRHQLGLSAGSGKRFLDEVGSHEVAHQWWGHHIGWKTYHDVWLSEGFAQFSAGLFIHKAYGDKKFKTFIDGERESIMSPLYESSVRANEAGPIWLGHRLHSEKTQGGYRLVYNKGGYVLHMLRMLMWDMGRNDESRFIAMMREFVDLNKNRAASTEDFQAVVSKHFSTDMKWFFDQYVYGTGIPKLSVQYSFADSPEGAIWKTEVTQKGVPATFRAPLPVMIRFKKGITSGRLFTSGEVSKFEIKLPEKPEAIEYNPFHGSLCELEVKKN